MPTRPTPGPASPRPSRTAPSGTRAAVERVSRPLLVRLSRLPRALPFAVLLALLLVGVLLPGPLGIVATALVVLAVAWVAYLAWPVLSGAERLGRLAVLLVAVALLLVQVFPRT